MYKLSYTDFNSISIETKLVLGITLHGVPQSWSLNDILHNITLYTSLKGVEIRPFISISREFIANEGNLVHLICDSLDTKLTLLKIRLIPFVGDTCGIILIRPMKTTFNFRNVECVYTIPEYTNIDIAVEMAEAMKLLDKENISLKHAIIISMNILNNNHSWDNVRIDVIWAMLAPNKLAMEFMNKLVETIKNYKIPIFKPFINENKYDLTDIFDINTLKWNWEINANDSDYHRLNTNSSNIEQQYDNRISNSLMNYRNYVNKHRYKNEDEIYQNGGCIRFEKNRNRWVADLTLNRFRSQKCFHISHYGLIGGLQAARKWRYDYMTRMNATISAITERKVFRDIWEKIHQMDEELWPKLEEAIKTPIEGYEFAHNLINIDDYDLY